VCDVCDDMQRFASFVTFSLHLFYIKIWFERNNSINTLERIT